MAAVSQSVLDEPRPSIYATVDLEWYCNDAPRELGQRSNLGMLLERASIAHEWLPPDARDLAEKKRGLSDGRGHHGKSYGAGAWREWVKDEEHAEGGYWRTIWGERPQQDWYPEFAEVTEAQEDASEMYRNVERVLSLLPARLRLVVLTQHTDAVQTPEMHKVFAPYERLATLSEYARKAYRETEGRRRASELSVRGWLEGVANRHANAKGKRKDEVSAKERETVEDIRLELANELRHAYAAYEKARWSIPFRLRYPSGIVRPRPVLVKSEGELGAVKR